MKMKKKWVKKVLYALFIVLCTTLVFGSMYVKKIYPKVLFDELFFYLFNGVTHADNSLIIEGVKFALPFIVISSIVLYVILSKLFISTYLLKKVKKEKYVNIIRIVLSIILLLVSIYVLMINLNVIDYIKSQTETSNFISKNYVDPKTANIKFPDKKRNLIIIFVESLETSMFTKEQGGYWNYEVVPELYELLNDEDVTVFYNDNKTELMEQLDLSSWTTGGDVANTSGLPLKIPIQRSSYHSSNFMQGAYSLGDVLKENGYYNEYISSARTSFGGLKEYFTKHGGYNILDINSYANYQLSISKRDVSDWGFNDNYLFEIAKKRLKVLANRDKPFNLILQTIDTHYRDGYIEWYSKDSYDTQYENVYATESELIYNFVKWLKEQDFYENTTIMIVGDHISMQEDYFRSRGAWKRYIYNCYINAYNKAENTSGRIYTAFDSYPTLLSSIGVKIEGDRLGLGVNLFSPRKTLSEEYGFDYFNEELNKKSSFYNSVILGEDYDKMDAKIKAKEEKNKKAE